MKQKLSDIFGYLIFLTVFIVFIPALFFTGGILRCIRYYKYISDMVHNREIKRYRF